MKWIACFIFLFANVCFASRIIPMRWVSCNGHQGQVIGKVIADDTMYGLLLTPHLYGLPSGIHGIHVHVMPSCSNYARAAGGHLDPVHTGLHRGPYNGGGHLGDLPVLIVDKSGRATLPILAPRLKLSLVEGHSLVINGGSDNYAENVGKQPGSNVRIACGLIPWY